MTPEQKLALLSQILMASTILEADSVFEDVHAVGYDLGKDVGYDQGYDAGSGAGWISSSC